LTYVNPEKPSTLILGSSSTDSIV